jgi:hypothetical protein
VLTGTGCRTTGNQLQEQRTHQALLNFSLDKQQAVVPDNITAAALP